MIRSVWVHTLSGVLVLILGIPILVCSLLGVRWTSWMCDRHPRWWAWAVLWASGVEVETEGMEGVEAADPRILVSNHESWFDVFALVVHLPVRYHFVAKKELSAIPVFSGVWKACGHIEINREDREAAIESLDRAGEKIRREDATIVLFPEGTRSPDGRLQPFKKGPFVLAIKAGVPVLPVAIDGSHEVMPKGSLRIRPGVIRIRVGEPISTEGLGMEDRDLLLERAWRAVADLKGGVGDDATPFPEEEPGGAGGEDGEDRMSGDRKGEPRQGGEL